MSDDRNELAWKVLLWSIGFFITVNMAISGYVITAIHDLQIRMVIVETKVKP